MSLWSEMYQLHRNLEIAMDQVKNLKSCYLEEKCYPPDFVYPLEKALELALESVHQQELQPESAQSLVQAEELVEVLEPWKD